MCNLRPIIAFRCNKNFRMEMLSMLVSEAYKAWQNEYWAIPGTILENTIRGYISVFEHHLLPCVGDNDIGNINYEALQNYYNSLLANGMCQKTIRNINQALQSLLIWCWQKKWINKPENDNIIIPKRRGHNDISNTITEKEYQSLKTVLAGQYKYAIEFIANTGIRLEEIALTLDCLDFKGKNIKICKAVKRTYTDFDKHKTKLCLSKYLKSSASYRNIPMTPNVEKIIMLQLDMLKRNHIESSYLFPNTLGCLIEPRNLTRTFYENLKKVGLSKRGVHSLRKLYIYRMVKNGMSAKTLQKIVGHEQYSTTMKYYLNITDEDVNQEAFEVYDNMKDKYFSRDN